MFNPYNQPVTLQAFMHFQLESPPKKKLDFTYLERSAASGSPFTHFTAIKSSRFPGRWNWSSQLLPKTACLQVPKWSSHILKKLLKPSVPLFLIQFTTWTETILCAAADVPDRKPPHYVKNLYPWMLHGGRFLGRGASICLRFKNRLPICWCPCMSWIDLIHSKLCQKVSLILVQVAKAHCTRKVSGSHHSIIVRCFDNPWAENK